MRAYAVTHNTPDPLELGISQQVVHFVGSEVDARQFRMELMKSEGLKRKDIEVSLVEIPTTKAELLDWLNKQGK